MAEPKSAHKRLQSTTDHILSWWEWIPTDSHVFDNQHPEQNISKHNYHSWVIISTGWDEMGHSDVFTYSKSLWAETESGTKEEKAGVCMSGCVCTCPCSQLVYSHVPCTADKYTVWSLYTCVDANQDAYNHHYRYIHGRCVSTFYV